MSYHWPARADFAAWIGFGATLAATGCGYTTGFDLRSQGIHTVGVQVVGNSTFRQRLEVPLTTQINEMLPVHSGLVPTAPATADAVLTVEIVDVQGLSLLHGGQHPVLEGALGFTVRVVLRNRRTGTLLRETRVRDLSEFRAPIGENEASAVREATADLARKIALALEPEF